MKMTKEQLAARLNGRQYGNEITREEEQLAKGNGLIVIFGASDDLCEMRGAIDDEVGCYDGGEIECEEYPGKLRAVWCPESGGSWGYETDLSHAKFNIYEDDMLYCVGIVIDLKECQAKGDGARNGWICVNEKMPPDLQDVIVSDGFSVATGYFMWHMKVWHIYGNSIPQHKDVYKYWQPLPEPPERSDKS